MNYITSKELEREKDNGGASVFKCYNFAGKLTQPG